MVAMVRMCRIQTALARFVMGLAVAVMACCVVADHGAEAQTITPDQIQNLLKNATPDQLQELQKHGFGLPQGGAATAGTSAQQPVVLTPTQAPPAAPPEVSSLEQVLSDRAGRPLSLFGYSQVGVGASVSVPQTGAVQDDYVLGPGDEVDVVLRGQENSQFSVTVDRNGQVIFPKASPVLAAGKTLAAFKQDLSAAIGRAYVATQAYISVGQLRQVNVLVAGEVANPGMRILTGLSNPLDAILLSGGIKKGGSLRNIQLVRHGKVIPVDLYGVLTKSGNARLVNLQDGDRVFVPSIGATAAVSGYVRRPAIYELPPGRQSVSAGELLALAAGPVLRGKYTTSVLRIQPDGRGQYVDISGETGAAVRDGELLVVKSAVDVAEGRVTLSGAVRTPGTFAVGKYKTLHDLLPSKDALLPGAYVLFGFVDRVDPNTMQHTSLPFSPLHVMARSEDVKLMSYDVVYVLTADSMQALLEAAQVRQPAQMAKSAQASSAARAVQGVPSQAAQIAAAGTSQVGTAGAAASIGGPNAAAALGLGAPGSSGAAQSGMAAAGNAMAAAQGDMAGAAVAGDAADAVAAGGVFGNKLTDYRVTYEGAVQRPGIYLAAPNTTVAEFIDVLGGLSQDVDLSRFELTSTVIDNAAGRSTTNRQYFAATKDELKKLTLQPYDRIVFHHVYSDRDGGQVTIEGEVRYPGNYNILRGERLSSVLERAGGLTEEAYPDGAVFLRSTVAALQDQQNKKAAADIRSQLFDVLMRPPTNNSAAPSADVVVALQALLTQIESQPALGRISIVADPAKLKDHPKSDPILQPEDHLVIPKVPTSVSVLGEVTQPGAFPIDSDKSARDYVEEAGGFTQFADTSRVIIVYPDGRAHVDESSWLSFKGSSDLPPGTAIVVTRDVTGLTFHQLVIDTTQVISQFATTAAALAVLSTNIK
jgi:protein involved in polysaccharide export with SLBB domain